MITSVADLTRRGLRDRRLSALLAGGGGWYLVGSRAAGFDDALSDWDTTVLGSVADEHLTSFESDAVFAIERPALSGPPTLAAHERWRLARGVDVSVVGPESCGQGVERLAEWAFELQHAVPLSPVSNSAEHYRATIAERFRLSQPQLALDAYTAFRRARNEAVACLPRPDPGAQALTAALCGAAAARFWLLALGEPHPAAKWLLTAVGRQAGPPVAAIMGSVADLRLAAPERFDALWQLWAAVDRHAREHGVPASALAASPFRSDHGDR